MSWRTIGICPECHRSETDHASGCPEAPPPCCRVCDTELGYGERVFCQECKDAAEDAGAGEYDPDTAHDATRAEHYEEQERR